MKYLNYEQREIVNSECWLGREEKRDRERVCVKDFCKSVFVNSS